MLRLRAVVTVLAVALLVTGWSLGDDPKDPPPPRGTLPANFKKLGLTDEQREAILKVRGTYAAKVAALRRQITQLQKEEREELEKLLTDAQKARLKEIRVGETKPKGKTPDTEKAPDKKS
jgi:hypothetical protein